MTSIPAIAAPPAPAPLPTGLLVLHGNRAETLAETVFAWLRRQPLAPLEEEVLLVQSNGMAEWLKMSLASHSGVCAATRVELPGRFLWRAYRQVLGRAGVPSTSPLDKTALTWRLMHTLPELLAEPAQAAVFAPVAGFLRAGEADRLFQLAERLADLFDQYQVYRSDWLLAWAAGQDVLLHPARPAQALPADQRWQPALWRALLQPLDETERLGIRPLLHQRFLDALAQGRPLAAPLPRRVVLFGMTHVPLPTLQALAALGSHCQVLLAIPNPCRFHWADIIEGRELLQPARQRRHPLRAGLDLAALPLESLHAHGHPLLAAWGRQGRDFVRQLDAFDEAERAQARFELPRIDLFDEAEVNPDLPLLGQVQAHVRDLLPLVEHPRWPVPADDQSIVFHIAHSIQRELEVLHDRLLALLARPPTDGEPALQPRDVVVMLPDIEPAAPAIRAVFGQYGRGDPRHIPFDIADLSARSSSPLVHALTWVLGLPQQRCSFSELRDLLEVPAVAARIGLAAEDLPQLTLWMEGAGIRWGLNQAQRGALDLQACGEQNTALFGLRRMLLGYASGAGPLAAPVGQARATAAAAFDDIEPYPEVGGLQAELAGCLASLLAVLAAWSAQVSGPQGPATPAVWAERCRALLAALFRATDEADRQTVAALDEALDTWLQACDDAGFDDPLPVEVLREAWLGALDEPTLNRRFRAGGVTFCTLMPMRAIPFEVVCLLGMNDGDYPRRASHSDFDLMAEPGQARPGDRSRRDDDRQLMLEAVLSARRALHVSWSGRSVRDNTEQPPSVLVSQLRDYLAAGWSGPVLADRTTEHPLQPFSRRYFEAGSALSTQAREWRAAHHGAAAGAPEAARLPSFVPDPRVPLSLLQLTRFVRKPVQTFFRERLNVVFDEAPEQAADEEPFTLGGLEEYSLVDQLSAEVLTELQDQDGLQGLDEPAMLAALKAAVAASVARVQRAGRLPMGAFAERTAGRLTLALLPMLHAWQAVMSQCSSPAPRRPLAFAHDFRHHGEPADVSVALADWLDGLHLGPDGQEVWPLLQPVRLCKTKPKGALRIDKLLPHWLRSVVAAACAVPADGWVVGRDVTLICRPPEPEAARATLAILLQCWFDGMREPLPMALLTGLAQLETGKAEQVYEGGYQSAGERAQDDCLARAFPDFEALQADGRFPDLAEAMLGPLLHWAAHCVTVVPHPGWDEDSEDGDGDAGERGEDDDDA